MVGYAALTHPTQLRNWRTTVVGSDSLAKGCSWRIPFFATFSEKHDGWLIAEGKISTLNSQPSVIESNGVTLYEADPRERPS